MLQTLSDSGKRRAYDRSIGVALYSSHLLDRAELQRRADLFTREVLAREAQPQPPQRMALWVRAATALARGRSLLLVPAFAAATAYLMYGGDSSGGTPYR